MNKSQQLYSLGQSIWYDNIQRSTLTNGTLHNMIADGQIYGVTSNPSIFNQAISRTTDYDDAILPMALAGCSSLSIYEQLTKEDIQKAADEFRSLYEQSNRKDGYVSIEVNPLLAYETQKMIDEARMIWKSYNRPNIMVKIPATIKGLETIQQLIRDGINVNVTLIFTISRYQKVIDAFFTGLEKRLNDGNPIDHVASVASFFVSRVDTKVDQKLQELSSTHLSEAKKLTGSLGKAAVANAKIAYEVFTKEFSSSRFEALKSSGAQVQRPLWASTGTKNPAYSDVLYVDELIGSETVNTVPPATLVKVLDHGNIKNTISANVPEAHKLVQELETVGISLKSVGMELEQEGVKIFSDSYNELITGIEKKRKQLQSRLGSLREEVKLRVELLGSNHVVERIHEHDASIWTDDPNAANEIKHRLGWLDLPSSSKKLVADIRKFREEILSSGIKNIYLLGMGGSSLAPEVFQLVFGSKTGLEMTIIDSTDPDQIRSLSKNIQLSSSLFIVSSKSGGTSEVSALLEYFWERCKKEFSHNIGNHFIAITDSGSPLEQTALSRNFRKIFLADPDVGGRYSVLTTFGLVPAGLLGINLDDLLNKAAEMSAQCRILDPIGRNPGLVLGAIMGQAAISGRDKVSLLTDLEIRPFGNWLEQLIAESSGKSGLGILPIVEDFSLPAKYSGNDRLTIYLRLNGSFDKQIQKLLRAKQPVIVFDINQKENLFQEFYKWEFAVAVACSVLRVNAFDQPDVQDNKIRTKNKIDDFKEKGKLTEPPVVWEDENVKVYAAETYKFSKLESIRDLVVAFIASGQKGDYLALNAYLPSEKSNVNALNKLRKYIQLKTSFATTRGFGPRFLHSTGQLHKGGASNGLFIQFTRDPIKDLKYGNLNFGILERAQALGDYESLTARGRRIIRIHIKKGSLARLVNEIT